MKSKKVNKICETCTHFNGKDCAHKTNVGVLLQYRRETEIYIKPVEELEKDCKNYAKA